MGQMWGQVSRERGTSGRGEGGSWWPQAVDTEEETPVWRPVEEVSFS